MDEEQTQEDTKTGRLLRESRFAPSSNVSNGLCVQGTSVDYTVLLSHFDDLANRLSQNERDLPDSMADYQQDIKRTAPNSPEIPYVLYSAGLSLYSRYRHSKEDTDLEAAKDNFCNALKAMPADSVISVWTENLISRLSFDRNSVVHEALINFGKAAEALTTNKPNLPALLYVLALSISGFFPLDGTDEDRKKTITTYRNAIDISPSNFTHLPAMHDSLGGILRRCGDDASLSEAIAEYRVAVKLTHRSDPQYLRRLTRLGVALNTRLLDDTDLDEAITIFQEVLMLAPAPYEDSSSVHMAIAILYEDRFKRWRDDADIEEALVSYWKVIESRPAGQNSNLPVALARRSNLLMSRFKRYGNIADRDEAIISYRECVKHTPGDIERSNRLQDLALALYSRYNVDGNVSDLEEAITSYRELIRLTPQNPPNVPILAARLHDFSYTLKARFRRS
jgi:tetratricopeptide (TPR) repeat protein